MLKKHYKFIIFILIVLTIFLIYKGNHKNYITYLPLGDGYALGINSYNIVDYGYCDFIKDKLQKENKLKFYTKKYMAKDESIISLTATIIANKKIEYNNIKYNIRQILRESDIVTLSIGLNDIIYQLSLEENIDENKLRLIINKITKDYNKLIKEIKKYYPKQIYIIGYPNLKTDNIYLNKAIYYLEKKLIDNKSIKYIKIKNIINQNDYKNPNSYYISNDGYQKIAKEVIKRLAKENET